MSIGHRLLVAWLFVVLAFAGITLGIDRVLLNVRSNLSDARDDSIFQIEQSAQITKLSGQIAYDFSRLLDEFYHNQTEPHVAPPSAGSTTGPLQIGAHDGGVRLHQIEQDIESIEQAVSELCGRLSSDADRSSHAAHAALGRQIRDIQERWDVIRALPVIHRQDLIDLDIEAHQLVEMALGHQARVSGSLFLTLGELHNTVTYLETLAPLASVALVTASGLAGALLVNSITKRLRLLKEASVRIGQGDLKTRIPEAGTDEVGGLAISFNTMAAKLEQLLTQLEHDAVHDALTDMPNRVLFVDRIGQAIARAHREERFRFAVMFIDLDRFKIVNDSLGHAAGDHLLCTIAGRLQALRQADLIAAVDGILPEPRRFAGHADALAINTVARFGGDEFTLLAEGLPLGFERQAIEAVARHVHDVVSKPVDLEAAGGSARSIVTPSIGIALSHSTRDPADGLPGGPQATPAVVAARVGGSADSLLRDADAALYRAKSSGRGCLAVFDTDMRDEAVQRLEIENALRSALERDEFEVYYQPVADLSTGKLDGFEALIRWNHDGQVISPSKFVSIAEDTGLITPIGRWVISQACRQLRRWQSEFGEHLSVAVNISRRQLSDAGLVPHLLACLTENRLEPRSLVVEITESMFVDHQETRPVIDQIRGLGIRVHIDDFGTGYSSLSCLNTLPADGLKIDRSFISDHTPTKDQLSVLRAIIKLAHDLGMSVVAEGVEMPEQLAMLSAMHCDRVQGYLVAKPLRAEQAHEFIAGQSEETRRRTG